VDREIEGVNVVLLQGYLQSDMQSREGGRRGNRESAVDLIAVSKEIERLEREFRGGSFEVLLEV
jgi:hypothetical protein